VVATTSDAPTSDAPTSAQPIRSAQLSAQSTAHRWDIVAREFAAWRAGDPAALERLVRLLTPVLWHLARAYGLERRTAEDVVQSTWLALVRNADAVRDPQAAESWITITTRREAWRVSRRTSREDTAAPETLDAAAPPVAPPDAEVLASDESRRLWGHVSQLSERCQRLLRVVAFEDRPDYASLSVQLGMPLGGLGPTRRRCLDKLRDRLAADPEWSDHGTRPSPPRRPANDVAGV
jgi:RNA polymerase sigma factor (sigma-70 family)